MTEVEQASESRWLKPLRAAPRGVPSAAHGRSPGLAGAVSAVALPEPDRALPLAAVVWQVDRPGRGAFWRVGLDARGRRRAPAHGVPLSARRRHQPGDGHADRLGAGPRRLPGQAHGRRADRPAVRAADDRGGSGAARLYGPQTPARHRPGLHPGRRRRGAAVRDAALRRAHGAARAHGARPRHGGGRGVARRSRATSSGGSCCPTCCRRSCPARRCRSPGPSASSARPC